MAAGIIGVPRPLSAVAVWARCLFCFGGTLGSLCSYGLLQERIMSQPYDGEYFHSSLFLVICNRLTCLVFASVMIAINGEAFTNAAPMWRYFAAAFSNVAATVFQYEALKYVSFPVQMLGKSFKMLPVMAWGLVVMRRQYVMSEWMVAFCVAFGVSLFLLGGSIAPSHEEGTVEFGFTLVVAFLTMDVFTAATQEQLFKHATSKYNQMLYINLGSALVAIAAFLVSGSLAGTLRFVQEHKGLLLDAGMLSASAVAGQCFIFQQVKEFGSIVFAATMNVRQLVSILLSFSVYGHSPTQEQIGGLCMVFAALFSKSCVIATPHMAVRDQQPKVTLYGTQALGGNGEPKVTLYGIQGRLDDKP